MIVTSVHVVVENKFGDILLTQRRDVPLWVLPGGHVNKDEDPKDAAQREFLEETGYQIKINHKIAEYRSLTSKKTKLLYSGRVINKIGSIDPREVKKISWFPTSNLPRPMTLYENSKISDLNKYSGKVIKRADYIDRKSELINQIKHPLTLIKLFIFLIYNSIFGSRSFRI